MTKKKKKKLHLISMLMGRLVPAASDWRVPFILFAGSVSL